MLYHQLSRTSAGHDILRKQQLRKRSASLTPIKPHINTEHGRICINTHNFYASGKKHVNSLRFKLVHLLSYYSGLSRCYKNKFCYIFVHSTYVHICEPTYRLIKRL